MSTSNDNATPNEQHARLVAKLADDDMKWLMEQKRGRRIVWRQLEDAGVFRSSFNQSASVMAFQEGQRNGGLKLLAQVMRITPASYSTMIEENRK